MFYHLILTDSCNLCCSYCRGKAFALEDESPGAVDVDIGLPPDFDLDLGILFRFLGKDPDAVLTFYGGEPLLRDDLVRQIMDRAPVKRYMIQTNGLRLDRLGPEYLMRFETILVSLDGSPDLTDRNRGEGVYRRVMRNVQALRDCGAQGELIARMTVTETTDIHREVQFLADNNDYSFGSIHWQIDANFWADYRQRSFREWVETSYNPGIRLLVREWVERMQDEGSVQKWYPFLGTVRDLLADRPSPLRCGAGHSNYTILTDGHIVPCPVMIGMKKYYLGHVAVSDPRDLPRFEYDRNCEGCGISSFCGGRCLYANLVNPWPPDHRKIVCSTVQNLHDALRTEIPRIKELISGGVLREEDFQYTRYNGCEIIP
ncbi:putative peptide-modifying radical SAM enzyme [Methanolinea mesophila]|nr:TIGR04084 family radical SAM/SPASM domain-containing protein [Methanolinea mesophila]MBP1928614.1 putative peptide-modifying radical SAM enzyme [Methanolinea mesophila]